MAFIQKFFTGRQSYGNGETRIGELDRLWYDSITNTIRISDGTPGGKIVSGSSMGSTVYEGATPPPNPQPGWLWWDSTSGDLFVYYDSNWVAATSIPPTSYTLPKATANTLGGVEIGTNIDVDPSNGKISVDFTGLATETYVTNLLENYNDLGNFEINGTNLQTLSGTVSGADVVINPSGGSVQVPSLKIGSGGNIVNTSLYIEAFITTYELVSIVDHSNTEDLVTGVYGNINGVPAPWTVFELAPSISGTPISAIQIDDKLTGAGIIPSIVGDRGTGLYANYVIVNLDLEGLGQVLPLTGAVFNLTRPLNKAALNVQGATDTDIFLDSQGLGDVIVNTNILPITTNISNLGSPTKRWKSIYVGPGTIYVLDETLGKDIAIGARDGLLYVQNGAGLTVGEFTLIDNQIKIADNTRDIIIGTTGATASVVFNRAIKVKDNLGNLAFEVDRTGLTTIRTPSGINYQNATLSIIGTASGHVQPRPIDYDGTLLQLTAQDNKSSRISSDSFGTGVYPLYAGRAAAGTVDAPTAVQSGAILSRFSGVGYGTTAYKTGIIRLDMLAAETFTDTAAGTKFSFQTTPVGTIAAQVSATIDSTGLKFTESADTTAGITFRNGDRLTYFPTPVSQTGKWLNSNGTTMSWQTLPTFSGAVVYKGSWNASSNSPALSTTTPVGLVSGWEYSIGTGGTQDINGSGPVTYAAGGFVIFNGTAWEYIPPVSGVVSIEFDGGSVQTGVVQVQSSDITSTLDSGSIANAKLAHSSITVTAGTGLGGGGTVSLGNSITLNNTGVTSIVNGTGISVSGTGAVTVTNTGIVTLTGSTYIGVTTGSTPTVSLTNASSNDTVNSVALRNSDGGLTAKDFTATLDASISSDHGPFNYGTLSYSDTGIMADFSYSANSYNQVVLQNRSSGAAASTNYIVSNDQGTATDWYGEFGMNSSGFTFDGTSLTLPNAVYVNAVSSDLVLGGSAIHFTIAGDTDVVSINSSGVATFANKITGSISGNADGTSGTTLSLSNHTTTALAEGTNKYYLDSRARASLSAGTGISYNSSTGAISSTITQYTDALARASLSAGTGISYNSSTGAISSTITQYTDALARAAHSFTAGSGAYNSTTGVITIPTNTNQLTNGANFITLASLSAGTGISYNNTTGVITNTITQYTDALARASLSAGTGISYNSSTGAISSTITQYTDALARGAISVSGSLSYNSGTGVISYTTPTYTVSTASASGGGALSLSGTTFTFTPASIPSFGVGGNQLVYVTNGAVTLGTTTATQSIFGLTNGVALASNTRYIYEINTVFELTESGPGDPDLKYSLAVSGGAVLAKHAYNVQMNNNGTRTDNSAGITMMSNDITTGFNTAVVVATMKNTYNAAFIRGTIDVTTGGNVNFMITLSKAVSALSIPQLSYVTLVPVGAIGANTTAGTWA